MLFLELYLAFVRIGFCSFGGLSMIPLINSEMLSHAWLTPEQVSDIVAIAEMTPGALGINCATFAGINAGGTFGSLFATLGVMTPSLTLCMIAGHYVQKLKDNPRLADIMSGVKPVCFGMILATIITLSISNYSLAGTLYWQPVLIGAVMTVLLMKFKLSIPLAVMLSAVLGILIVR